MKTSIYSHQRLITAIALLAAVPLMWSCSDEQETDIATGVAAEITAGIGETTVTRAVGSTWQNNDEIGVCVTNAPSSDMETAYANVCYREETRSNNNTTATFAPYGSNGIYFQNATEDVTFTAYGPYNSSVSGGKFSFDCSYYNGSTTTQENIDFIYAGEVKASASNPKVNFTFSHVMAKLNINFKVKGGDNAPTLAQLQDESSTFKLFGITPKGTFDVKSGAVTATAYSEGWEITDCYHEDTNNDRQYSLIVPPQDLRTGGLTLLLSIKGLYLATTVIDEKLNLESGNIYTLDVTVDAGNAELTVKTYGITVAPWTQGSSSDKVTK